MSNKRKLLITGGSGFIGKNLIRAIKNYDLVSVSRNSELQGVKNIKVDLTRTNFTFLEKVKPDYVVYLGTISSPKEAQSKPQESYESNVLAIQKFLEKAKGVSLKNLKKIILFSSSVVYKEKRSGRYKETDELDSHRDIYNFSKFNLENLSTYYYKNFGLPITVFRLSNTYGPFQDTQKAPLLIPSLFEKAIKTKKITVWNTKPIRDWVYIGDVVDVVIKEMGKKGGGIFNLGTGKGNSVGEIVRIISKLTGAEVENLQKDVSPPYRVVLDVTKLKERLNYLPRTPLEKGLRKTYKYYLSKLSTS